MASEKEPLVVGSDHAGISVKEYLKKELSKSGHPVIDVGSHNPKSTDDYPDFAKKLAKVVKEKKIKGILVCGTGTGMVIAANKVKGIRAAPIYDSFTAKMARVDNDANVAVVRGRNSSRAKELSYIKTFLRTPFSSLARHKRRIKKIQSMER